MGIRRFTPAYDLARECAKNYRFALDWHQFLTDKIGLKLLLGSVDGPDAAHGPSLDTFRTKLAETAKHLGISRTTLWRRLKAYGLHRDGRSRWARNAEQPQTTG